MWFFYIMQTGILAWLCTLYIRISMWCRPFYPFLLAEMNLPCNFILHRVSLSLLPTTLPSIISHSHQLSDVVGHPFLSSNEYVLGGSPNKKFVELKIRQITGAYIAYTMLVATHQMGRLHFPHTHAWCRYSSIVWPDLVKLLFVWEMCFSL